MKLEQSQLDYLSKRGKNYDKKYYMFESLLNKIPKISSVIELFGGVGIETYYLKKYCKDINIHYIIEKDNECYNILKNTYPHINVLNEDTFNFEYNDEIDLLIVDSTFTKTNYKDIVNLIHKFNCKYIILTNTGVFNVKFNKNISYDEYWDNLKNQLQLDNLYLTDVEYYSDFGMMLIETFNENKQLYTHYIKNNESLLWRNYRDKVLREYKCRNCAYCEYHEENGEFFAYCGAYNYLSENSKIMNIEECEYAE